MIAGTEMDGLAGSGKWVNKVFGIALYLVVFTIPFGGALNSASIILLAVCWIAEGEFASKIRSLRERPIILLYIAFYGAYLIGMLYTENRSVGQFNLEKKMTLLALPIILGTSTSFNWQMRNAALWCFVVSCCLAALINMGGAIYQFVRFDDTSYFFHEKLTSIVQLQTPYFGMFMALTIVILTNYWLNERDRLSKWMKIIWSVSVLLIICYIVLLSARTAIIFITLYGVVVAFTASKKGARWAGLGICILAVGIVALMVAQSEYLQERFVKPLVSDITAIDGGRETGLSIRIVKWKCSLVGFKDHPILGVGTGDATDTQGGCYEKEGFWGMYPQYRYNSHNQYLEVALTLGLMGLLLFLASVLFSLLSALQRKDYLFLSFLALFSFCCLTESILERQWGIVFFTFFVSLFTFSPGPAGTQRKPVPGVTI